jgi:branched-chain amino acid transport system permease protein
VGLSVVTIFLMGLSFSFLIFLLGSGLSLTFGLMQVLNLAHGAYYLIGSYVGLSIYELTGNFLLAILAGIGITGLIGIGMEQGFIRYLSGQLLDQVLLTMGFLYIFTNLARWIWGPIPQMVETPSLVAGSLQIGAYSLSVYHLVVIFIGLVIAIGLWLFQQKTQFGAIIRAGIDNREMVTGLGINFRLVCMWVFCLGTVLAGIAGVIGLPLLGAYLDSGMDILLYAVIVVTVGGLGSLQGALLGSLIIGMVHTVGKVLFPPLAFFMIYLLVVVILLVRPSGLLGERETG